MEWSSACLIPLAYIIVEAIFIDGSNRNTRFYIIFLCGIGSVLELSFFVSFIVFYKLHVIYNTNTVAQKKIHKISKQKTQN
jgi:hypothetical protein